MQPIALLPVRTVEPAARLLTVDEVNAHLRLDAEDLQDDVAGALVLAVESHLDGFAGVLGRALITQTWTRSFDFFPCGDTIRLPLGPLQSIESVTYFDRAGDTQTLASSKYHAIEDARGPAVRLADTAVWPDTFDRPDAVTVAWTCGYGDEAFDVPAAIVHAAKLMIGHFFKNREAVAAGDTITLPLAVDALLEPFRSTPR